MLASALALLLAATPSDAPLRVSLESAPRSATFLDLDSGSGGGGGEKSVNPLLFTAEVLIGTVAGYAGVLAGIALNVGRGGFSEPVDVQDILYLFVLPVSAAGIGSWVIGLLDLGQRNLFFSSLHSLLGAVLGEAVAIGVGFLLAALFPAAGLPALFWGAVASPAFVALGATVAMEALKSGHDPEPASSAVLRQRRDGFAGTSPLAALAF